MNGNEKQDNAPDVEDVSCLKAIFYLVISIICFVLLVYGYKGITEYFLGKDWILKAPPPR